VYATEEEINARLYAAAEAYVNIDVQLESAELELSVDWTGPFHNVHFTEQRALEIIRAELEAVGLNFGDREVNDFLTGEFRNPEVTVFGGVEYRDWDSNLKSEFTYYEGRDRYVIYNLYRAVYESEKNRIITERLEDARQALTENLNEQVQNFIERLQREGVL
jgi:hypothetical protein